MLPLVSNLKTKLIAGTVAFALMATSVSPAMAYGKDEQNMVKGALAVLLLGAIMRDADHHARVNQQREQQQPVYQPRHDRDPVDYYTYRDRGSDYQPPVQSYYNTPAAMAFNAYSGDERRRIQGTLANYGYYNGPVDGSFGPGTYRALTAYASQTGKMAMLETRGGAFGVMDGLLY
jgi:hypothetical protein